MFGGPELPSVLPHTVRPGRHIPLRDTGKEEMEGTGGPLRVNRGRWIEVLGLMGSERKDKIGSGGLRWECSTEERHGCQGKMGGGETCIP